MKWLGLLLVMVLAAGVKAAPRDAMCEEIARFANATQAGGVHAVTLTSEWGATFSADKNVLYRRQCNDGGYAPGGALCRFLMQDTSVEFPHLNFRRALACLGGAQAYVPGASVTVEHLDAAFSSFSARGVHDGIEVTVAYSDGGNSAPPKLSITAKRSSDQ